MKSVSSGGLARVLGVAIHLHPGLWQRLAHMALDRSFLCSLDRRALSGLPLCLGSVGGFQSSRLGSRARTRDEAPFLVFILDGDSIETSLLGHNILRHVVLDNIGVRLCTRESREIVDLDGRRWSRSQRRGCFVSLMNLTESCGGRATVHDLICSRVRGSCWRMGSALFSQLAHPLQELL